MTDNPAEHIADLHAHLDHYQGKPAELAAHLEALHPDYEYLNADKLRTPYTAHWTFHFGEWAHRAVATHLIEGHGYSVQTVRNNPSPQLVIEHVRMHNEEFADINESTWNHTHEPPKVWVPEVQTEDVVGRVVVVKVRRQDRSRWDWDSGIKSLREQGAMMVLFMDVHDSLETLNERQMNQAGWVRAETLKKEIDNIIDGYTDSSRDVVAALPLGASLDQLFLEKYSVRLDDDD